MPQPMSPDRNGIDPARRIARLMRVLHAGSSSPALVETADGSVYVAKLAGSGAGPHGLLTEFLGSAAARALGIGAPPARPLFLPKGQPWLIGTDEFDDLVQRSAGWNLGIAYLPEARPLQPADLPLLPGHFLAALITVDRLLQNVDRGVGNPNLLADRTGYWAIDFGSCLFVNRIAAGLEKFSFDLPANHFLAGSPAVKGVAFGDAAVAAVTAQVAEAVNTCPDEWLCAIPFGRDELVRRFRAYASAFAAAA